MRITKFSEHEPGLGEAQKREDPDGNLFRASYIRHFDAKRCCKIDLVILFRAAYGRVHTGLPAPVRLSLQASAF